MKTTFDNAKKRCNKNKKHNKEWWIIKTKNYTIPLYYLWLAPFVIAWDKISTIIYNNRKWTNKRADKVLDKFLSKALTWDAEENEYYICIRKFGPWYYSKRLAFKDRKWVCKFDYKLRNYLVEEYENKDYVKTVIEDYDWWTIVFCEKN